MKTVAILVSNSLRLRLLCISEQVQVYFLMCVKNGIVCYLNDPNGIQFLSTWFEYLLKSHDFVFLLFQEYKFSCLQISLAEVYILLNSNNFFV